MSLKVINGKVFSTKATKPPLDAPTPSQIAERAYDLAIEAACLSVGSYLGSASSLPDVAAVGSAAREWLRVRMAQWKAKDLAALRESVINPDVAPWWRE